MSDLKDFFAKKDKKKKKPGRGAGAAKAAKNADGSDDPSAVGGSNTGAHSTDAPMSATRNGKDDGWIDIDDAKAAQVNTGGRTVADFNKHEKDEKEANGDDAPTEKFSGWTVGDGEEVEERTEKPTEVGAVPVAAYPSLADTANAPKVPKNAGPGGGGVVSSRPRYGSGGGGFGALKKKLEEMRAAEEAAKKK